MIKNGSEARKYSNLSGWENLRVASATVIHIMIHECECCRILHLNRSLIDCAKQIPAGYLQCRE